MRKFLFVIGLVLLGSGVSAETRTTTEESLSRFEKSIDQLVKSLKRQDAESLSRFRLFTNCQPVRLMVLELRDSEDAIRIGLKRDEIITAVRSRLRASSLYDAAKSGLFILYVEVLVLDSAFSIHVKLVKFLFDINSSTHSYASTWETSYIGVHGNSSEYIMSGIYKGTDEFIDEWYRVNKPNGKCLKLGTP